MRVGIVYISLVVGLVPTLAGFVFALANGVAPSDVAAGAVGPLLVFATLVAFIVKVERNRRGSEHGGARSSVDGRGR